MKRILFVLVAIMVLALAGCTQSMRLSSPPSPSSLPDGFSYVSPAGNGYFLYQAGPGYFLVSSQRQGSQLGGIFEANVFVDIVYVGKELLVK
jgi:nitrous oxide reductase accessory protein NosL